VVDLVFEQRLDHQASGAVAGPSAHFDEEDAGERFVQAAHLDDVQEDARLCLEVLVHRHPRQPSPHGG
jgi:hypothetical protein